VEHSIGVDSIWMIFLPAFAHPVVGGDLRLTKFQVSGGQIGILLAPCHEMTVLDMMDVPKQGWGGCGMGAGTCRRRRTKVSVGLSI
jgi:hypothetical protein